MPAFSVMKARETSTAVMVSSLPSCPQTKTHLLCLIWWCGSDWVQRILKHSFHPPRMYSSLLSKTPSLSLMDLTILDFLPLSFPDRFVRLPYNPVYVWNSPKIATYFPLIDIKLPRSVDDDTYAMRNQINWNFYYVYKVMAASTNKKIAYSPSWRCLVM